MVAIRLHRLGVEALLDAPPQVGVHRVGTEVAVSETGGGAVQLHRLGVEVLAKVPPRIGVQRVGSEAAVAETGAGEIQLHRLGVEALLEAPEVVGVNRIGIEAAVDTVVGGPVRFHRLGIEVLARTGFPNPVPLPLAADIEFFMHNWADELSIETSYETDVIRSPETLAEERRSLWHRPQRVMQARWLRMGKEEIYQLRLLLRRATNENLQFPLYCDATDLLQNATSSATEFFLETNRRRFYVGARVLFFRISDTYISRTEAMVRTITGLTGASLTVNSSLGVALNAGEWAVVPLIDCDEILDPEVTWETTEVAQVSLTVRERRGKNALPPLHVGLPPGFQTKLGRPVFEIEPNWINGISTSYRRYGYDQKIGRRLVPLKDGSRYSQVQEWNLDPVDRRDWYRIASMFDSRRGRAESFWAIDREFSWTVVNTTTTFVDIAPYGRFVDFNQIWTESNIAVAIRMRDGTIHLAQVNTVSNTGAVWRLTLVGGQFIASGIDLSQIDFVARARLSRFVEDVLSETWVTNNTCGVRLRTIEVQNEKVVDFDT